jgi:hypothetical protein
LNGPNIPQFYLEHGYFMQQRTVGIAVGRLVLVFASLLVVGALRQSLAAGPPDVTTLPIRAGDAGQVFFQANVNPEGTPTTVSFLWYTGTSPAYAAYVSNTPPTTIGSGTVPVLAEAEFSFLTPFIFSVQAIASNDFGSVTGNIVRFIIPPWTLLPAAPQRNWHSLASSADGTRLAAVSVVDNYVWLSSDSGRSWTARGVGGTGNSPSVAMSADGRRITVGFALSSDFGQTWTYPPAGNHQWTALACSADGLAVVGAALGDQWQVLRSTNGGVTWTTNTPPILDQWTSIASSADGRTLIVAASAGVNSPYVTSGTLFTSTNAGLNWVSNNLPKQYWTSVASSADGRTLFAATSHGTNSYTTWGSIYISTNSGGSWSVTSAPVTNWLPLAVSANGRKVVAACNGYGLPVFTSTDMGATWQPYLALQKQWQTLALSADGDRLFGSASLDMATLQTTPAPQLEGTRLGQQLLLSWVIPSTTLRLQKATDLFAPQWTDVTNSPILNFTNLHYQVVVPLTGPPGFYRLGSQ